jgi:hypothetical protein
MKRSTLLAIALGAILLLVAVLPASARSRSPFRGTWRGTDSDESTITLKIVEESRSGGQVFDIRGRDDKTGTNWCSSGGDAQMSAVGVLLDDGSLAVSLIWWCLPPGQGLYPIPGDGLDPDVYTYDPSTDTITDKWEVVYNREP